MPARDLAGAARNFGTAGGIKFDKATNLRGLPTEVVEHRHIDMGTVNRAIAELRAQIDAAEAESVTDAEVVTDELPPGAAA